MIWMPPETFETQVMRELLESAMQKSAAERERAIRVKAKCGGGELRIIHVDGSVEVIDVPPLH